MNVSLVVDRQNHLTLDEHVKRLLTAQTKMREGLWEFIDALKEAQDQLPPNTFQNELGIRLGMKKSVLSKWIAISDSIYLLSKRDQLPPRFSSLYILTLIEKKYLHQYGDQCSKILDRLIENDQITPQTERSGLEEILQEITQRIRKDDQSKRQEAILSLSGGNLSSGQLNQTLEDHIQNKSRFRSFVVIPPKILMQKWSDGGYFSSDIADEFPLHELRAPSMAETLSCLIRVKMKDIETGIKLINAWGFSYRDVVVPPTSSDHCAILNDVDVLVRGERGQSKRLMNNVCLSFEVNDILEFVEQNCGGPNLLVFHPTDRKDWSCLSAI
jgi:hypothetical protein